MTTIDGDGHDDAGQDDGRQHQHHYHQHPHGKTGFSQHVLE